jgi:hypothetical protein
LQIRAELVRLDDAQLELRQLGGQGLAGISGLPDFSW